MKVSLVEKLNIPKPKQQDFEGYSSTELLYTLEGVLNELNHRGDKLKEALSLIDKQVSSQTHEIELIKAANNTEKISRHDNLSQTMQERRKLKQELVIINRVNTLLDVNKLRMQNLNYLHCLAGSNETYSKGGKLNRELPSYKKGELKRLFKKYKKVVD